MVSDMREYLLIAYGLLCCLPQLVQAGLEWDTRRINYVATLSEDKAEASFKFTNTGEHTVTINTSRTSCGCTTVILDKMEYDPGESGDITAVFAFGNRAGKQHKRITLRTSEPRDNDKPVVEDTHLYFRVTIPQPIKVRPRMVYWKPDEPHTPKAVRVTIDHEGPVNLTNVEVDGVAVSAEIKTVDEGKHYELIITPNPAETTPVQVQPDTQVAEGQVESGQPLPEPTKDKTVISFQAEFKEDVTRTYTVMARVMQAPTEKLGVSEKQPASEPVATTQPIRANSLTTVMKTLGSRDISEGQEAPADVIPSDQP